MMVGVVSFGAVVDEYDAARPSYPPDVFDALSRDDETCMRWHGFDVAPDRKHRVAIFAEAYGLESTAGLIDAVIERLRLDDVYIRALAARNLEPQATWVRTGEVSESIDRIPWIEQHRDLLE